MDSLSSSSSCCRSPRPPASSPVPRFVFSSEGVSVVCDAGLDAGLGSAGGPGSNLVSDSSSSPVGDSGLDLTGDSGLELAGGMGVDIVGVLGFDLAGGRDFVFANGPGLSLASGSSSLASGSGENSRARAFASRTFRGSGAGGLPEKEDTSDGGSDRGDDNSVKYGSFVGVLGRAGSVVGGPIFRSREEAGMSHTSRADGKSVDPARFAGAPAGKGGSSSWSSPSSSS